VNDWLSGLAVTAGIAGVFWAGGKFLPELLVKKMREGFDWLKASAWLRDPNKPKRARWFVATLELLEDELPEPGQGKAFYDAAGVFICGLWAPLALGGSRWAKVLEKAGDALDTELDREILELAQDKLQ
jgi:hypothetical protein